MTLPVFFCNLYHKEWSGEKPVNIPADLWAVMLTCDDCKRDCWGICDRHTRRLPGVGA